MGLFSYNLPAGGEGRGSADTKVREALSKLKEGLNGKLNTENLEAGGLKGTNLAEGTVEAKQIKKETITAEKLAAGLGRIAWYTPKVIAAEESREAAEFGFLTTEDKIENVVLAESGLILVSYRAIVKQSGGDSTGKVAVFLGINQLRGGGGAKDEGSWNGAGFATALTAASGMTTVTFTENVTTGQIASHDFFAVEAAAGTYTVGVKYRATAGKVTAKERKLRVAVLG